jgi:hypothetical protein
VPSSSLLPPSYLSLASLRQLFLQNVIPHRMFTGNQSWCCCSQSVCTDRLLSMCA